MISIIWNAARSWVIGKLGRFWTSEPPPMPAPEPVNITRPKRSRAEIDKESQKFIHVSDLLAAMPRARRALRRLKKFDPDAYHFHRKFGARIGGREGGHIRVNRLRDGFVQTLPAAGLVYLFWKDDDGDDGQINGYAYFEKIKGRPWNLETCGPVKAHYNMTLVFDAEITSGYETKFAIMPDGAVRALKSKQCVRQWLPNGGTIHHNQFDFASGLYAHAQDKPDKPNVDTFGALLFTLVANAYDATTSEGFQITAKRDGLALSFNIPAKRAPQFFRNRDIEAAADGRRKRIFHGVEEHERTLADGRVVHVAAHYRGARIFSWQGEDISIHPVEQSARCYDVESFEENDPVMIGQEAIDMPTAGAMLADLKMKQARRRGGYQPRNVH